MLEAMHEMAGAEGVVACPEGAATLVGLRRLVEQRVVDPDETIILLNTGSGYKYLHLIGDVGVSQSAVSRQLSASHPSADR